MPALRMIRNLLHSRTSLGLKYATGVAALPASHATHAPRAVLACAIELSPSDLAEHELRALQRLGLRIH